MDGDVLIGAILLLVGMLAGFIDSIVGGGGLISLPALLLTDMPIAMALGTNKLGSSFGSSSAMISFAKQGMINWRLLRWIMPFSFVISILGAILAIIMPPVYLRPVIIALLFAVLVVVLYKKDWGQVSAVEKKHGWTLFFYILAAFMLALYDGFIGPGTGMFLIFYFLFLGYDFLHASGNAKALNTMSNLGSLMVYIYLGQVNYLYGVLIALGQMLGATLGVKVAVKKGATLVRTVYIIVTVSMLLRLLYDYLFIHS